MKNRIVIIGTGKEDHEHFHKDLRTRLTSAGFEVDQRYHYPRVTQEDAKSALEGEDLEVKESGWIRDIPSTFIEQVIESAEDSNALIWGESAIVEANFNEVSDFINELPEIPRSKAMILPPKVADKHNIRDMEFEEDESKNTNAPFSYDPNNDYYTEPENY